ncbi:MAG TPA: NUDIX domain-containing protein [Gaiellaceae bacterium]|nr:NUDIX domain-containing protein [Gaiellaceae bacterium]
MRATRFYDCDPDAPEPNRPRAFSVYALIERDEQILLERRVDAPLWSLIAGRVEGDETLTEGLIREVREETGLHVRKYEFFGHFSDPSRIVSYPDGNVFVIVSFAYRVTVESFDGLRPSAESEELRFFPKADLRQLDLPATQRAVVEHYLDDAPGPHLE